MVEYVYLTSAFSTPGEKCAEHYRFQPSSNIAYMSAANEHHV